MSSFSPFVNEFMEFKNNSPDFGAHDDNKKFGWKMSNKVKNDFKEHLTNEWPDAPEDMKNNFNSMFEKEGDLLGIQMLDTCQEDTAYLLKATEKKKTVTLNIACFSSENIYVPKSMTCPVTGKSFFWPQAIKPTSVVVKDSRRSYQDSPDNDTWGTINFDMNNFKNDIYASGRINYRRGNIVFARYSKDNENSFDKLLAMQNLQIATGCFKDSDTFQIEFIAYEEPVKVVWTYKL